MRPFVEFILHRGRLLAVLSLVSLVVPLCFLPQLRIDNSIEVWLGRRSEAFQQYQDFRSRYGSDELVIVAASMPQPLSEPALAAQRELAEALRRIDGIRDVSDLPQAYAALSLLAPQTALRPQDHPLIRNLLLASDGQSIGVIAWLKPLSGPTARRQVVDAVREAAQILARNGYEPHIVGTPVLNVALDRASSREARRLLPIAGALSAIVLVLLLRSIAGAVACLAGAAATVLWTLAAMAMAGLSLNLISVALPSLLLVLSIAPGIHIALRFLSRRSAGDDPEEAMRQTLRELFIPILLTTLTTMIGFASLMVTDMQPVFEVGLFAGVGMALSWVLNLTLVPGLLRLLAVRPNRQVAGGRLAWTARVGGLMARNRWAVAGVSLILTAACALLAGRIRTESNILSFLPAGSTVVRDYQFVSQRLTGLYTLELDVAVPASEEEAALGAIAAVGQRLAGRPDVARVDHYAQLLPVLERTRLLANLVASPVAKAASHFRTVEQGTVHLRASFLVRSMASEDFYALVDALRREASARLPKTSRWDITGAVLLLNNAQSALVQTQVRSFAIAGGLVLGVIGLLFGSWRVLAAAVVPNLLPVLGTFALMAVAGIPIDPATVMIASVAIGLAVDSTIHFVASYRLARPGADRVAAAAAAMERSGRPIVFASLVAAAGFALLCLAEFRPLADFGLLTSATLLTAMICDLTVTPAWAGVFRLWEDSDAPATAGDNPVGEDRSGALGSFRPR